MSLTWPTWASSAGFPSPNGAVRAVALPAIVSIFEPSGETRRITLA